MVEKQGLADLGYRFIELDAEHKSTPTHLADPRRCRNIVFQPLADFERIMHKVFLLHDVNDGQRGCHGQIVSAECRPEHAFGRLKIRRNQHASYRKAVPHAFCYGYEIRDNSGPLVREESACTAITALNLVQDKTSAIFSGQCPKVLKKNVRRDIDAADSLDAFDYHACDISFREFYLNCSRIIQVHESDIMMSIERRDVFRVVSHGDRPGSASVETVAECDDAVLAGMERCQFECIFIGLGTGVYEEQGPVFQS